MNRIDRLTAMIMLLQSRRVVTAEQVAEHFEISVRTVYRDFSALGEAGVPIVAEAGVGYGLMRGYHMPPVMFTEEEAAALFMSGELAERFGDESLKESLKGALLKVRAVLPEERKDYLSRLGHAVGVSSRPTGLEDERSLMPVQEAVVRKRCVRLVYDAGGRGELTERVVEALGVVFYGRHWHLIGWCRLREGMRDFRLDRVREWEVLEEIFEGHEDFSVVEYLDDEVDEVELTPVVLRVARWGVDRALVEMPCRIVARRDLEGGVVEFEVLAYSLEWLASWLLGLGTGAEVVSPPELGDLVAGLAREVVEHHGGNPPVSNCS